VTHAVAAAALEQQVGRVGHALHAAGDHHLVGARQQHVVGEHRGLHAGAAHLGERHRPRALGQATLEGSLPGGSLPLAGHQAVAEQHFAHGVGRDASALDRGPDGGTTEIVRGQGREIALERTHGCACGTNDDNRFRHGFSFVGQLESA
jgi:hypothetical protein